MSVPFFIPQISESYIPTRLRKKLGGGWTVIFGAGIGVPYFTSDTATIQRALEIEADCIYMIKNGIDGIYDKDPNKEKGAKKYRSIPFLIIYIQSASISKALCIVAVSDVKYGTPIRRPKITVQPPPNFFLSRVGIYDSEICGIKKRYGHYSF